jgi:hypothetical protein
MKKKKDLPPGVYRKKGREGLWVFVGRHGKY